MKTNIIEIMKAKVCFNHKSNCTICPILNWCKEGDIDLLIQEFYDRPEFVLSDGEED